MRIIDMHCDTLIEGWRKPERSFYDGETSINLKLLKEPVVNFPKDFDKYDAKVTDKTKRRKHTILFIRYPTFLLILQYILTEFSH